MGRKTRSNQIRPVQSAIPEGVSVGRLSGGIPVETPSGERVMVYAQEQLIHASILGMDRKYVRFQLEAGEIANLQGNDGFVVVSTGEKLVRVK
jgi:hypothetical protein